MAVKRYNGSSWDTVAGLGAQGAAATSSSIATWVKTASGGETSLSGNDDNSQALSYTIGQELVFINGVLQKRGADYTANTGNSIIGLSALTANDIVSVWTVNAFSVSNAIANTIVDAKGDILVGTGADTPGRLAVGTNGQVLTAASTTGTGLSWVTPSSGGMTLLSTTTLSGSTVTISSIDQSYTHLQFYVYGVDISGQAGICFQNSSPSTINSSFVRQGTASQRSSTNIYLIGSGDQSTASNSADFIINLYNYTSTKNKMIDWRGRFVDFSDSVTKSIIGGGFTESSAAISSVEFLLTGGPTFQGGTVLTYGVK